MSSYLRFGTLARAEAAHVAGSYLDLLTKVLTNTLVAPEPSHDAGDVAFVMNFIDHYVRGPAYTMLPVVRLKHLRECVAGVIEANVPGDLIETGVWRGGATIFMRAILRAYDVSDRTVWVADSFEGLPEPDASAFPNEARAFAGDVMQKHYDRFRASYESVRDNFAAFDLLDDRVRFLKGWFAETLPGAPIGRLAVLRLDGDYYQSTRDALEALYDKVSIGGYVIVDDYGEDDWTYCRRAVDEFRASRDITEAMQAVDRSCWFWQRKR